MAPRSRAELKQLLVDLLPSGSDQLYALGNQDGVGGTLWGLAGALKETLADRIEQLRVEVNPSTILELIPDWEQALGLSQTPIALYGTPDQRRNAVLGRLRMSGSFSLDDIRAIVQPYFLYQDPTQIEILEASRSALETAHTYAAPGSFPLAVPLVPPLRLLIDVPDDGRISPAEAILNLNVTSPDLQWLAVYLRPPGGTWTLWDHGSISTDSLAAVNQDIRLHDIWHKGSPIQGVWTIDLASNIPATVNSCSLFVEGVGNLFAGLPPVKVGEGLGSAIFNFAVVADPTKLGPGYDLEGARRAISLWKPGHVNGILAYRSLLTGLVCAIPDSENAIPDIGIPC